MPGWHHRQRTPDYMDWLAIQTIPRREPTAAANLNSSGLETFLPLFRRFVPTQYKQASTGRYGYYLIESLFPGYLFARLQDTDWGTVRRAQGVRSLVRMGDRPARVDEWIIEGIRLRMNEDGLCEPQKPAYSDLLPDTLVEIRSGLTGIFIEGLNGGERVALLMNIMGCDRRVILDRADVTPALRAMGIQ